MPDPIYLIDSHGKTIRMEAKAYDSEDEFQALLRRHPELLPGEQIDRDEPRQWLLIGREIAVSDEGGGKRWFLDHLFVDQDGIPTLVEVKRQSDPRLRREVVGQVLDYAAHAQFWTATFLASEFEKTCREEGSDPAAVLSSFTPTKAADANGFWREVEERLRAGEMRLVFLADAVPRELQQIVEFLNEQMSKTEVLAVEVTRYAAEGFTTHVPRVFGLTSEAQAISKQPGKAWSEETFFEAAAASLPNGARSAIRSIYDTAKRAGLSVRWGKGAFTGSFNVVLPPPCERAMFTVLSDGKLWLNIWWMYGSPQAERAAELLRQIAPQLGVPEQNMKAPAVRHEVWVPEVSRLLAVIESITATST